VPAVSWRCAISITKRALAPAAGQERCHFLVQWRATHAIQHGRTFTTWPEAAEFDAAIRAGPHDSRACGTALATAERSFDRATQKDNPAWLAYFDEAYLAARMAQCFRD
jgi:hypothetical protein